MSHELRTPLNTIIGYTSSMLNMPQMYQGQPLPQVFRSDIALILENGQYLLELINDILDLSKIEADKFDLNPTIVDLNSVFKGVIATSIGLIKDKPIQIQPSFPEALPKVWADPSRVRQILLNLMSNAIKYTDTGTVRLQADVVDDLVRIQVIDTGVGIKPELLSTIFDRFKQAQTNTNIQGTGLGLDISQRLVAMHGGKITLKSVVGQGSTFAFTLPLATPEQLTTPEQRVILPTEGSITIFAPRKAPTPMLHTVLLVEDDAEIRRLIRNTLEREGCTVVDMTDGTQVVDMATGLLPDVLLLDVDLPDADVWGIVEALRADPFTEALPILFIGAHPQPEQAARLNISGALSKPIEPAALLQAVGQTLALPLSVSASLN
jgi:CheY-like chemotaxis protein